MGRANQRTATATKVLATASRLFHEQGFANTTVRDIAAEGGVSVGTVMSVGDKNVLLLATFDNLIKEIHEGRRGFVPAEAGNCVGSIVALLDPFVELFAAHPALARAYRSILVTGDYDSLVFTDLAAELRQEIEATLAQCGCAGDGAAALAQAVYFAYMGVLLTWMTGDEKSVDDIRGTLRAIVAAMVPGSEES